VSTCFSAQPGVVCGHVAASYGTPSEDVPHDLNMNAMVLQIAAWPGGRDMIELLPPIDVGVRPVRNIPSEPDADTGKGLGGPGHPFCGPGPPHIEERGSWRMA